MRRGACPGLFEPMQTGDGLLARVRPRGTMPLAAFAGLCAAARARGNGIIEVTARGSIQVRGLNNVSAKPFAAEIAALDIAATDGIPILTDPLGGIGAHDVVDARELATDLGRRLTSRAPAARLAPKISVAIDGGGTPSLDAVAADVRLCAAGHRPGPVLEISIGGDGAGAAALGCVAVADGAEAAVRLLDVLAQSGPQARARDVLAAAGMDVSCQAIADLLFAAARSPRRGNERATKAPRSSEAVGLHALRDGSLACGVGLAFGHADASSLERLAKAAAGCGASGMRAAPGYTLLAIGLTQEAAAGFAAAAEQLGFITRPDDPRRRVFACPGAPFCGAALIPARTLAPPIAKAAAEGIDAASAIHISGCPKGCAHPAPAALTVVGSAGGCALVADGTARQAPFTVVPPEDLPAAIARYARKRNREANDG